MSKIFERIEWNNSKMEWNKKEQKLQSPKKFVKEQNN